ncbi:hypothetical protein IAT38_004188 [Cryptococcus sp. DSM 104549]
MSALVVAPKKVKPLRLDLNPPPYMTPMPHARVGFSDLPVELVEIILAYTTTFYGMLLACKRTCALAGELLYANGLVIATNYPSLVRGYALNRASGSPRFGNKLKRRFVSRITSLRYTVMSECSLDKLPNEKAKRQMTHDEDYLQTLFRGMVFNGIEPFPSLLDIVIDCKRGMDSAVKGSSYMNAQTRMMLQFMLLCRPRSLEWGMAQPNRSFLSFAPEDELRFARGHLPLFVQHNIHHDSTHGLTHHQLPFPCYGTHNIIHMTNLHVAYIRTAEGCGLYIEMVNEVMHPERTTIHAARLGSEQKARRLATTWDFAWSSPFMENEHEEPMEMLEDTLEEVYEDFAAVFPGTLVSSPDIWRRRRHMDVEEEKEELERKQRRKAISYKRPVPSRK